MKEADEEGDQCVCVCFKSEKSCLTHAEEMHCRLMPRELTILFFFFLPSSLSSARMFLSLPRKENSKIGQTDVRERLG